METFKVWFDDQMVAECNSLTEARSTIRDCLAERDRGELISWRIDRIQEETIKSGTSSGTAPDNEDD